MERPGVLAAGLARARGRRSLRAPPCDARHVKNLPGRKTDVSDACWIAQLAECDCSGAASSSKSHR